MSEPSERMWGCRCCLCDEGCGPGEGLAAAHFDPDGSIAGIFCGACVGTGAYTRFLVEATYVVVLIDTPEPNDLSSEGDGS